MLLSKDQTPLNHINSITHDGKVLVFATADDGTVYYTVRADGFENNLQPGQNWGNWLELPLPDEKDDPSVVAFEEENFTNSAGNPILRSKYSTKTGAVTAPVQLISGLGYLYVFRQKETGGYLWVDRFVLDGMNNRLIRKLEVRYKRSKQKYAPLEAPSGKGNIRFDSLHFRDADGNPFYEPTIELNLQATMANGWFSVVLLPTEKMDGHRWHFFFYHTSDGLDYVSVRASAEGLFDLQDRAGQAGFELRNLRLDNAKGKNLKITGPPVATKYDQQAERENQMGETHLVRTATKVMLVVPTKDGAASLDFSVAVDGRLSYLSTDMQSMAPVLLSGKSRTLQLPPDTLDQVNVYRSGEAPATGRILGMEKEADGRIRLHIGKGDPRPDSGQILIKGTQSYNGLYTVASVNDHSFEIEANLEPSDAVELRSDYAIGELERAVKKGHTTLRVKESIHEAIPVGTLVHVINGSGNPVEFRVRKETSAGTETIWIEKSATAIPAGAIVYDNSLSSVTPIKHELGEWEEAPPASNTLTAEGEITALQPSENGMLRVQANEDVRPGDNIQIKDSNNADGWYDVVKTDEEGIVLDAAWQAGEVINRSHREYKGIQMLGKGERFDIEMKRKVKISCLEIRFKTQKQDGLEFTFHGEMVDANGAYKNEMSIQFELKKGVPFIYLIPYTHETDFPKYELGFGTKDFADGQWHHLSYVWGNNKNPHTLCLDGTPVRMEIPFLDHHSFYCKNMESDIYSPEQQPEFEGQLSELRLWNQPRTNQEVRETMYDNLTGREANLAGYWPMGAISNDNKLLDLSENKNHGLISGNIFIPGVQLERDDTVIEFRNETLIAVTQGAAYTESFEFRPHGGSTSDTANFNFKYKGKRSRNADEWTEHADFKADQHANEPLADGWQRASCSFVVPEGVSLLRSFGIDQLGKWDSLEVRNHSIRLTSNSISKQIYLEQASLPILFPGFDDGTLILSQIKDKELEKADLHKELLKLPEELKALTDETTINARRGALSSEIASLKEKQKEQFEKYLKEKNNLLNYWMNLGQYKLQVHLNYSEVYTLQGLVGTKGDLAKFKFIPSDTDGYYLIASKAKDRKGNYRFLEQQRGGRIGTDETSAQQKYLKVRLIFATDDEFTDDPEIKKEFEGRKDVFKIKTISGGYIGSNGYYTPIIISNKERAVRFYFNPEKAEPLNSRIDEAKVPYDEITKVLNQWEAELADWNEHNPPGLTPSQITDKQNQKKLRWKEIEGTLLPKMERDLVLLRQRFKDSLAPVIGIPMPKPPLQNSNLPTNGSLLNFIQTDSNLHLFPSADGNIYLSYFDRQGQLRQPYYDTVSDQNNTTFEAWVPESHRLCLDVSNADAAMKLPKPIPLDSEWTIECRFFYPFPEKTSDQYVYWYQPLGDYRYSNVLVGNGWECAIMTRTRRGKPIELGSFFKNYTLPSQKEYPKAIFYPCGYDMRNLETGWHHMTVVGKGFGKDSNTLFYIDGEKVGDIKAAATDYLKKALNGEDPDDFGRGDIDYQSRIAKNRIANLEINGRIELPIQTLGIAEGGENQGYFRENSFAGKMAEVRVWNVALSHEEVEINAKIPSLRGTEPGLLAYFPLNGNGSDSTQNGYDAMMANPGQDESVHYVPFTGPLNNRFSGDGEIPKSIISNEYSTAGLDPIIRKQTAILRRFMAYPVNGGVELLSQQRIEELELLWIGNAQINPTLLGFIEGAPPVPSENLTEDPPSYQGATAVELVTEEELTFSWNREDTSSLGLSLDLFVGAAATVSFLGLGGVSYKVGVSGGLALSNTSFNQSNIGSSAGSTNTDRLELRGHPETKAHFPHLGPRFVPKNVGYALVVSGTADVYITRLKKSKKMIAYTVLPSPDIPLDVNTITFLINPAYTMNGSLDGLTGTRPTSERFFEHVIDMRAQYGSAFPASYYRVQEAYDLKEMIEKQDKERAAYFANFDVRDMEGAIDRATGDEPEDDSETERIAKEKQEEMEDRIEDEEARAHAFSAFATWQRKMEDLQIKAGKRNIVNTYVWDADGGLRVEEQQFAGTIEHTVGGSFEFSGSLGVHGEVEASGFGVGIGAALTLEATLSMSQTMSKTESSRKALSLQVDLSGVESQGITDFKDNPLLPGEKVDRYRFMSFYLEGSSQHFEDFFNEVVDPEWLAGNDEEARALRQAQAAKPNKTWRVLHRVTYVERPALQGFGKK